MRARSLMLAVAVATLLVALAGIDRNPVAGTGLPVRSAASPPIAAHSRAGQRQLQPPAGAPPPPAQLIACMEAAMAAMGSYHATSYATERGSGGGRVTVTERADFSQRHHRLRLHVVSHIYRAGPTPVWTSRVDVLMAGSKGATRQEPSNSWRCGALTAYASNFRPDVDSSRLQLVARLIRGRAWVNGVLAWHLRTIATRVEIPPTKQHVTLDDYIAQSSDLLLRETWRMTWAFRGSDASGRARRFWARMRIVNDYSRYGETVSVRVPSCH